MSKRINTHKPEKFLREGKRRKIAHYYGVSVRTIARYIYRNSFVGIAKRDRLLG